MTTPLIPRGVMHAVAELKVQLCQHIDSATQDEVHEARGWKVLLANDALLLTAVKGEEDHNRRAQIAEGLLLMEAGRWRALWATMTSKPQAPSRDPPKPDDLARRVAGLVEV